jgi:hemolysin activation/secretion protein
VQIRLDDGIIGALAPLGARRRRFRPTALGLAGVLAATALAHAEQPGPAAPQPKAATAPQPKAATATQPKAAGAASAAQASPQPAKAAPLQRFDIDDFAVEGADKLPEIDLDEAVYPFLGPSRTSDDVEKARAALEKAYHDKGYQTVSVAVPQQNVQSKVVTLKVTEMKVGRLRVKNARYFDVVTIKEKAPSLQEGSVPNFGDVTKDIVSLNLLPDRRVTPALRAGVTPGTVDVDLNVEDKLPLHASVELNNRQSPETTPLRLNATVHYDDLWQLGHSLSVSFQVAPENPKDALVFSGSYLARVPNVDWLGVLVYGLKSSSNVATIGGANVVGPGQVIGSRAVITLPNMENFFHTLSVGLDYKHFEQTMDLANTVFASPVTYYPVVGSYGATYQTEAFTTQFNAAVTYNIRSLSSDWVAFDIKRTYASANFTHLNMDLSHTQELPEGFQIYGKIQGQVASGPLVSSEEFSVGGLDTVRGYLESEVLGDEGVVGNFELRSPDLADAMQKLVKEQLQQTPIPVTTFNSWRFFAFADAGLATVLQPLPQQQSQFDLWSYGGGLRFKMFDYVNGMVACSVPMITQAYTHARDARLNFRIWGEF